MKLLYFTLGTSLLDEQVRRQLVRIPEVLSEIRKVKLQAKLHSQDPVMAFLGLNDFKNTNLKGSLEDWVAVVQKGLFNRLRKSGFKYSNLFKRSRLQTNHSLESVFVPLLQSKSSIEVYVVGPGFDDLKAQLDRIQKTFRLNCDVVYIDVISQDTKLKWFWSEIATQAEPMITFAELDLSRH
jgi:hypothetical protein